jgi:hypothetical protein
MGLAFLLRSVVGQGCALPGLHCRKVFCPGTHGLLDAGIQF